MLIYLVPDSDEGLRVARYGRILFRRFEGRGLVFIAIVRAQIEQARALAENMSLPYPVVADADGRWGERLRLSGHPFGLFVIDPAGKLQFATTKAQPQDLRQLAEKHLLGTISYAPTNETPRLKVGMRFPDIVVEDLRRGHRTRLQGQQTIIYFTGKCPSCSLASHLAYYLRLRENAGRPPVLLFSPWFSPQEVLKNAASLSTSADLYLATEGVPGIEDGYYLDGYFPENVLMIATDATGTVTDIRPLT